MGTKNDQTMIHCLIWKIDGRNELDKISFDRIECPSLSRSAYCASPYVYVCVCVFFAILIKLVGTSQRMWLQQRRFTIDSACKRKIARLVPSSSLLSSQSSSLSSLSMFARSSPSDFDRDTADKRGVAFERKCESCIASRNRKRKGKFSTKGTYTSYVWANTTWGRSQRISHRSHAQWSVKRV